MAADAQTFVGLDAYSRDGERIGEVEGVVRDLESDATDCLVIRYGPFRDLVVPVDAVERLGGRVTVPVMRVYLDAVPGAGTERAGRPRRS
jgi:sporulation protein YlmC with PRC-barrel domain